MTDEDLIREFAATGSEPVFRQLVEKHCDLVFSIARRVTRDPELARDVSQQVFSRLAAQPASAARVPLTAWLHRKTHSLAVDLIRREEARHRREARLAIHMKEETSSSWTDLEPVIDALIDRLPEPDRHAILMRFYDKSSHRAIGQALGLTEDAARKRIDRALERLREMLRRRGITTSASALATALPAHAVMPAPAAWVESLSLSSRSTTALTSTTSTLTLFLMKYKTAAIAASLLLLAGATYVTISREMNDSGKHSPTMVRGQASSLPMDPVMGRSTRSSETRPQSSQNPVRQLIEQSMANKKVPKLTPAQVEHFLERKGRSAENLLAASRLTGSAEYLKEAASRYPTNATVQYERFLQEKDPEQRKDALRKFQQLEPGNGLGNLSAAELHLTEGNPQEALLELKKAAIQTNFDDFNKPFLTAFETAYRTADYSPAESQFLAYGSMAGAPINESIRGLAEQVETSYRAMLEEHPEQAQDLLLASISSYQVYREGTTGVVYQLMSNNAQSKLLQLMDPSTPVGPHGETAAATIEALRAHNKALAQQAIQSSNSMLNMNDAELSSHYNRFYDKGEAQAAQEFKERGSR